MALTLEGQGYNYNGKNVPELIAKCKGELLSGVGTYFDLNADTNYDDAYESTRKYSFIPYTTSILSGWGKYRTTAANGFGPATTSNKLYTGAAKGCCPIPIRYGLDNSDSPYISTKTQSFTSGYTYSLTWSDPNIILRQGSTTLATISNTRCLVIDLVARGGDGGSGKRGTAMLGVYVYTVGGGGGGAGGMASIFVDMSQAKTIYFDATNDSYLYVKNASSATFLTLNKGGNGTTGKANADSTYGVGGSGGGVSTGTAPTGVTILWTGTQTGTGGAGGEAYYDTGTNGGKGGAGCKCKPKFITENWALGVAGGDGAKQVANSVGGGGGASSFLGAGAAGGNKTTPRPTAGLGGGGAGGWGDPTASNGSTNSGGSGGNAGMKIYYESDVISAYTASEACSNYDSGDGPYVRNGYNEGTAPSPPSGGCVFAGTRIAIDKDNTIDIIEYRNSMQIDYCDPNTLEHSPQQTLTYCFIGDSRRKITLGLEDGKTLSVTANHPILTKDGFKSYLDGHMFPKYQLGELIATVDGYKELTSIQDEPIDPTEVYNLITEKDTMVANGFIVGGELEFATDFISLDRGFEPTDSNETDEGIDENETNPDSTNTESPGIMLMSSRAIVDPGMSKKAV